MSQLMRRFDRIKDDNNRTAYHVTCDYCERYTNVVAANQDLPPELIAKKARQRGWEVSKHGSATCPVCAEATRKHKEKPLMVKPAPDIAAPPEPTITALPPRTPTPTDLRRIMREIDENWDEPKARYAGAATDQTIADKLNVPRAWVAEERKRAFGDSQRNEQVEKAIEEMVKLKKDCSVYIQRALDAAAAVELQIGHIDVVLKRLEKIS